MSLPAVSRKELLTPDGSGQITLVNHGEAVAPPIPNRGMAAIAGATDVLYGLRFCDSTLRLTDASAAFTNLAGAALNSISVSADVIAELTLWQVGSASTVAVTLTVSAGVWDVNQVCLVRLPLTGSFTVAPGSTAPDLRKFDSNASAAAFLNTLPLAEAVRYYPLWVVGDSYTEFLNGALRVPLNGSTSAGVESQYALDATFDALTYRTYQQDNAILLESGNLVFRRSGTTLQFQVGGYSLTYLLPGRRSYAITIPADLEMTSGTYLAVSVNREVSDNTTTAVTAAAVDPSSITEASSNLLVLGYWNGSRWTSRFGVAHAVGVTNYVPASVLPLNRQGFGEVTHLEVDVLGVSGSVSVPATGYGTVYPRMITAAANAFSAFTEALSGVEAATVVSMQIVACRTPTAWGIWPPSNVNAVRLSPLTGGHTAALEASYLSASIAVYAGDVRYGVSGTSLTATLTDLIDRVDALEVSAISLDGRLDTAEGQITSLTSRVTSAESAISAAESDIAGLESDVDVLQLALVTQVTYGGPYQIEYLLWFANQANFGTYPTTAAARFVALATPPGTTIATKESGDVVEVATDGQYLYALHEASNSKRITKHTLGFSDTATPLADVAHAWASTGVRRVVCGDSRVYVGTNAAIREFNSTSLALISTWTGVTDLVDMFIVDRWVCVVHENGTQLLVDVRGGASSTLNNPSDVSVEDATISTFDLIAWAALQPGLSSIVAWHLADGVTACSYGRLVFVSAAADFPGGRFIVTIAVLAETGGLSINGYVLSSDSGASNDLSPDASACDGDFFYLSVKESVTNASHVFRYRVIASNLPATLFDSYPELHAEGRTGAWVFDLDQAPASSATRAAVNGAELLLMYSDRLISIDRITGQLAYARSFSSAPTALCAYWGGALVGLEGLPGNPATQSTILNVRTLPSSALVVSSPHTDAFRAPFNQRYLPRPL